jgi:hypothetical protein
MLDKCKRSCNLCGDLTKSRDKTSRIITSTSYNPIRTTVKNQVSKAQTISNNRTTTKYARQSSISTKNTPSNLFLV